jgi:hypothetical protein
MTSSLARLSGPLNNQRIREFLYWLIFTTDDGACSHDFVRQYIRNRGFGRGHSTLHELSRRTSTTSRDLNPRHRSSFTPARRLNWSEAFSRAQWAPTKGPSLLNQRLGAIHGGAGEARGAGGWVPDPPGHANPGCALENESPAGRSAGGCQVVGAGPRPPGLGRNWAQTEAQRGWWGPGSAAGGGAAASPRLLFKPHNIKVREGEHYA